MIVAEVEDSGTALKLSGGALGAKEKDKRRFESRIEIVHCYKVLRACRVVADTEAVAIETGP